MVNENNESNAVDLEMNSDFSDAAFFFSRRALVQSDACYARRFVTICFKPNTAYASTFNVCQCDF